MDVGTQHIPAKSSTLSNSQILVVCLFIYTEIHTSLRFPIQNSSLSVRSYPPHYQVPLVLPLLLVPATRLASLSLPLAFCPPTLSPSCPNPCRNPQM